MTEHYSTVDKIVRETLVKMGEDTDHKYEQFLPFAYDGLDELNYHSIPNIKDGEFEICRDRDLTLPADCVDYVMVGILVGNCIKILRHNNNNPLAPKCCDDQVTPIYSPVDTNWDKYYFNNLGLYGYGYGGYEHTFSYNRSTRTISFSSDVNLGKAYVKYLSSDYGKDSLVDPIHKKALEYYLYWQYYMTTRRDPIFKEYKHLFYNELENKIPRLLNRYSAQDHYEIINKHYSPY